MGRPVSPIMSCVRMYSSSRVLPSDQGLNYLWWGWMFKAKRRSMPRRGRRRRQEGTREKGAQERRWKGIWGPDKQQPGEDGVDGTQLCVGRCCRSAFVRTVCTRERRGRRAPARPASYSTTAAP